MSDPDSQTTPERILAAAERLFAEGGIAGTSLRAITAAADVNLAAVNYHFGSKEELVGAVMARRLGPLNEERLELLDRFERESDGEPLALESILEAFLGPAIRRCARGDLQEFLRLMGRMLAEPDEAVVERMHEQFGEIVQRFGAALARALPELSPAGLAWRFHFMVGSMAHVVIHLDRIEKMTNGLCDPGDLESTLAHMIAFVAGGMRAPAPPGEELT